MQILTLACATLAVTLVEACAVADEVREDQIGATTEYDNCLYTLVTVQQGDDPRSTTRTAAKGLRRIARNAEVKSIVLNGFAHLAPDLADQDTTQVLLDQLAARLTETAGIEINVLPYGWRKRWCMEVLPGIGAQRSIQA